MDDAIELAAVEPAEQIHGWDEIGELAFTQVAPLVIGPQRVIDHDIGAAGLVEARHHVRSDETGSAGDQ